MDRWTNISLYPRVLIIGQSFDRTTGGGITMTNLFSGWPKDRIALASATEHFPDTTVCERCYRLGSLEDRWKWPLSHIDREGKVSGPVRMRRDMSFLTEDVPMTTRQNPHRIARKLFYRSIDFGGVGDLMRGLWVSRLFLAWFRDFGPDVIYTQLSTLPLIRFVTQVIELTRVPLVIHIMDDWPSTVYQHGLFSPYVRWRTDREFRALLRLARVRMAIGHKMAEEYNERYGYSFLPFHNVIETAIWLQHAKQDWSAADPFRLVYTGRIGRANSSSVQAVSFAVSQLRAQGNHIRLDLYTRDADLDIGRRLATNEGVFVHPSVLYEEMPSVLADADLLVLPLDFDADSVRFARYSMPTKTPEYMISGTPILVYAPADLAVSEYARDKGWGYLVSDQSAETFKETIVQLMADHLLRERLGRRAQELAIQNHDTRQVREAFRQALTGAATGHVK